VMSWAQRTDVRWADNAHCANIRHIANGSSWCSEFVSVAMLFLLLVNSHKLVSL
jgi:hypothetical protein